jgi:hypothetical protein
MKQTYKALNDDHKDQIDGLIDHTITCALQEDLEVDDSNLDEDDEDFDEKLDELHDALLKESLDYLIERLTKIRKEM